MLNTYQPTNQRSGKSAFGPAALILGAFAIILALFMFNYWTLPQHTPENGRLNMSKSSGRNGKHANPKAREKADDDYEKVKHELDEWTSKPNKTPEDKDFINKLRKKLKQLQQKKDFSGENHSQKHKGH